MRQHLGIFTKLYLCTFYYNFEFRKLTNEIQQIAICLSWKFLWYSRKYLSTTHSFSDILQTSHSQITFYLTSKIWWKQECKYHFFSFSAPTIFIVDEQGIPLLDKYYEVDSTIQLTCIVRHISMMSSVVFWIHNNFSVLNYDVTRGGIR